MTFCPLPLLSVVKSSLLLPTVALLPTLLLTPLATGQPWGGIKAILSAWRAAVLCVFGWSSGGHLLEVIFTERVAMATDDDPQPTAPLIAALKHNDPIVQVCAFLVNSLCGKLVGLQELELAGWELQIGCTYLLLSSCNRSSGLAQKVAFD